jgi:hypothetical protein
MQSMTDLQKQEHINFKMQVFTQFSEMETLLQPKSIVFLIIIKKEKELRTSILPK